jgi:hypothetical protein
MKVNKIIALRLMLSINNYRFSSCSKKSSSKTTLQDFPVGILIVKGFQSKKQEAGPGLVFC